MNYEHILVTYKCIRFRMKSQRTATQRSVICFFIVSNPRVSCTLLTEFEPEAI